MSDPFINRLGAFLEEFRTYQRDTQTLAVEYFRAAKNATVETTRREAFARGTKIDGKASRALDAIRALEKFHSQESL